MLGDSVVGVKHLSDPRGGKPTPLTWALLIAGALLLATSVLAFHAGIANAAHNETARTQWIQELGKPAHTFRPARISLIYDWMAFGGALGGLLALAIGLARLRGERQSPCYRIGTAPGVDFPLHGAPGASFPLVAPDGDIFAVHLAAGMDGEMRMKGGQLVPMDELQARGHAHASARVPGAMQVAIPPGARLRVALDRSIFLISSVSRPRRQPAPVLASVERRILAFVSASAVLHLGIVLLLLSLPPAPQSLAMDLRASEMRHTRIRHAAHEQPKPETDEAAAGAASRQPAPAMDLPEGRMGHDRATAESQRHAMKKRGTTPQLERIQAIVDAREHDMLTALRTQPGGAFASITGVGHMSSGLDELDAYGGYQGEHIGEAYGSGGFGMHGNGLGGGGWIGGTIGSGEYGTIGQGPGAGTKYGYPPGNTRSRSHQQIGPQVRIAKPSVVGDLDGSILRRHIRKHLARIRYCYERQLQRTPGIAGTVITEFQLSPGGVVIGAQAHGVHDEVARCVAGVIQSIQFPALRGGTLVKVRYPFTFRTAGS